MQAELEGRLYASYIISLQSLGALDDIELNLVTLLEGLISILLDGTVVDEDIWTVTSAEEAESLCAIEPFHFTFVLCHGAP